MPDAADHGQNGERFPPPPPGKGLRLLAEAPRPVLKRSLLMALLAICYLEYYFFDVMIEIGNLPAIIVFVPLG